jgi:hypothetical protein
MEPMEEDVDTLPVQITTIRKNDLRYLQCILLLLNPFTAVKKVHSKKLELYLEANKPSGDEPSAQTKMECSNF